MLNVMCSLQGVVMVIAGLNHLQNPYFFLGSVYSYGIVSQHLGVVVSAVAPFALLISGICLLSGSRIRGASIVSILLFSSFMFAQLYAAYTGTDLECGCFGPSYGESKIGLTSIIRSTALLLSSIAILVLSFYCRQSKSNEA